MGVALAVDVGGTKIAAALVSSDGDVHPESVRTVPTPATADSEVLFGCLAAVVDEVRNAGRHRGSIEACGVGCGGPMKRGGEMVSPLNIPAWRDFALRERLREHLSLPVFVENDAKALALGEGWIGAGREVRSFIAMVVSTGVGGGIVLEGRLLDGDEGNAGHIGHMIVEPGGMLCGCGARGCLEAEASGTAIRTATGKPASDAPPVVRARTGRLVGRAVASVANLLDLRLAIVSGSVALGYAGEFFDAAQAELDSCARLDFSRGARIVPGALGSSGPLVGAAAVAWRRGKR